MLPLVVLAWETFPESYSAPPWVASEEEQKSVKGLNGEELDISLRCHQALVSIRDILRLSVEGKLQWKVCLHPHLEQGGMPLVERSHGCGCHIFLFYRWELAVPEPLF